MSKDEIFEVVKNHLVSDFNVEPDLIAPDKSITDDLDMDSLDLVDLLINLKDRTGDKVNPNLFKNAKTIQDILDLLYPVWS